VVSARWAAGITKLEVLRSDSRFGTCIAIVQCASFEGSSSTGASSGTAAAVVVVSSHSIGSGLRVIARVSTSSMRETGMISRPFLMLSLISTRSLAFSSGMSTVCDFNFSMDLSRGQITSEEF
jgi:hypothetical protein